MAYVRNPAYRPGQKTAYKISRSKIDLYMQCPRCFWLDVRLKIRRPSSPPFQINKAIDTLLKKEFDAHRKAQTIHPLVKSYDLELVPYQHEKIDYWRNVPYSGVEYLHPETNLIIWGGVDDIWVNLNTDEITIVDYKATSKNGEITLDAEWQEGYKRQIEIYQWLFRANGFKVSDIGYFVYTNGRLDLEGFFDKVEFKTKIIPHNGSDGWVEPVIKKMKQCMDSDDMPAVGNSVMGGPCEYCTYAKARTSLTLDSLSAAKSTPNSAKAR